ncbi:MAG: DoxX family protein [Bacteroidia bacterium]|nr:DoxX family protein [Bacteroidia bacterium]
MIPLEEWLSPIVAGRVFSGAMLAVLFLQSGLDKVFDREGNLSWIKDHFSESPLVGNVPFLLTLITVIEILAGLSSFLGIGFYLFSNDTILLKMGVQFSCLAILMLFAGQRIAKKYEGAADLVPYFIMALLSNFLYFDLPNV